MRPGQGGPGLLLGPREAQPPRLLLPAPREVRTPQAGPPGREAQGGGEAPGTGGGDQRLQPQEGGGGGPAVSGPARHLAAASEEGQGQEEVGGGLPALRWLALSRSRWFTILLSPFTCSPTSFLLTFLLSLVIFISQDIKHSCPLLYLCMSGLSLPLLPHTPFLSLSLSLSFSLSFSCSPLKSWVEKAGPHRQGVAPERV